MWGARVFNRHGAPEGPAVDLLTPNTAAFSSTTSEWDDAGVSSGSDDEGLSQFAARKLGNRFCMLTIALCTIVVILGCVRNVDASMRGEAAADAIVAALSGGNSEDDDLYSRARTPFFHEGDWDGHIYESTLADFDPDTFIEKPLLERAGRGGAAHDHVEHDVEMTDSGPNFWGNSWMKLEINRALNMKRQEMNSDMREMAEGMQPKMSNDPDVVIDKFSGMDSMHIDKFEAMRVSTDVDAGTAMVNVQMKGGTRQPLVCWGKASAKKGGKGPWYRFTIKVSNFWFNARRISGDVELGLPPVMQKAKVGWVDSGFGQMDATCFSKKDNAKVPTKKDKLCTDYLNKKLSKDRGEMIWKISKKLTQAMQEKVDTELVGMTQH